MSDPPRRLRWPWPADTVLDRSRRLLQSYRAALGESAPLVRERLDTWAVEHGEGWVVPSPLVFLADDLLTVDEVATYASVKRRTVYRWHELGLPWTHTPDGIRVRAGDLLTWERERRQRRIG